MGFGDFRTAEAISSGIQALEEVRLTTGRLAQEQARIAETRRLAVQASEKQANDARDHADGLINYILYDMRYKLVPIGQLDVLDDVAKKAKE